MHSRIVLLLIALLTFTSLSLANPIKRGSYCIGSPAPIYIITNVIFQKHFTSSPDVYPSANVTFDFADIYHGFSTKCNASIADYGGAKSSADQHLYPKETFDGLKSYYCADGNATQFRFADNGTLSMLHKWTCLTPGPEPP
jgi:hypothetical protein